MKKKEDMAVKKDGHRHLARSRCVFNERPSADEVRAAICHHILSSQGRDPERAGPHDVYKSLAYTLRDQLVERWINTQQDFYRAGKKRVYYMSLEFLVGRSLGNSLVNLGLEDEAAQAVEELGFSLEEVREREDDAALGNGGLGRLAACFLDSMATLGIPGYGYGIRYEYGLFYQRIVNGYQAESPDNWLRYGTPWEFERPEYLYPVRFYGRVETWFDEDGRMRKEWVDTEEVMAMACDILVPGYRNGCVLNMRLWTARASREFDLGYFNRGNYVFAVEEKVMSETISKVLYPSDELREGQELRLKQQYFFVAATFQDIFRRFDKRGEPCERLADHVAVQLNDTHPAIAIPELMRILVDNRGMAWEDAWKVCVQVFAYTNHTLMPEALETWPVELLGRVLPRHLEIIYEINRRFLADVENRFPGDVGRLRRMSLICEEPVKSVRMAHLAIVGSHSVNGVAMLHTRLMRERIFADFAEMFPERFNNKTNGITQRRWLLKCNPGLAELITGRIGDGWITDFGQVKRLEPLADDPDFRRRWREIKRNNKEALAAYIAGTCGVRVDPASMFDVQVKRIHEYKRQLLNVLHVICLYRRIKAGRGLDIAPRTVIFAGKAAPSYWTAKLIIKLINSVAAVVNADPRTQGRLRVVFVPNYGVSLAERIIPAADLSEQISTASTEASGTGNMKFAINGALTIGTLDGANIEIREAVGEENIFIFGLTADEVERERREMRMPPSEICRRNPEIRDIVAALRSDEFCPAEPGLFQPLVDAIMRPDDPYLVLRDLEDYIRCQERAAALYLDADEWSRRAILNLARCSRFSSDRAVMEYAREIWRVKTFRGEEP